MARGDGKHSKQAQASGKLSAFIKPKESSGGDAPLSEYVDWGEINGNYVYGAVVSVNREGGSLLFGHTRDKRSYSVVVFYGGDKTSYYFPCSENGVVELEQFLISLVELAG